MFNLPTLVLSTARPQPRVVRLALVDLGRQELAVLDARGSDGAQLLARHVRGGPRAAHEPEFVRDLVGQSSADSDPVPQTTDDIIARRADFLTAYQNAAYARRYGERVLAVRAAETRAVPGSVRLWRLLRPDCPP